MKDHAMMHPGFNQEISPEQAGEPIQINPDSSLVEKDINQSVCRNTKERRIGAARMAGSLFWTNLAAVVLLIIGGNMPGWLTIRVSQKIHYSRYSEEIVRETYVFQDYGLWYVTQCNNPGIEPTCLTMPYRVIDAVYDNKCNTYNDCEKIEIGSIEISEKSKLFIFSGAGLVFGYPEFIRMQAFYTIGILLSFTTLYYWYLFRKDVTAEKRITLNRMKWASVLLLALFSAVFVLIPAIMFVSAYFKIKESDAAEVKTPVGSAISGTGGALMALTSVLIFMQLICCRTEKDVYICSCLDEEESKMSQEGI